MNDPRTTLDARFSEPGAVAKALNPRFAVADGAFQHDDGAQALVFAVAPRKVLVFGKGSFSQTRHRFGTAEGDDGT